MIGTRSVMVIGQLNGDDPGLPTHDPEELTGDEPRHGETVKPHFFVTNTMQAFIHVLLTK